MRGERFWVALFERINIIDDVGLIEKPAKKFSESSKGIESCSQATYTFAHPTADLWHRKGIPQTFRRMPYTKSRKWYAKRFF